MKICTFVFADTAGQRKCLARPRADKEKQGDWSVEVNTPNEWAKWTRRTSTLCVLLPCFSRLPLLLLYLSPCASPSCKHELYTPPRVLLAAIVHLLGAVAVPAGFLFWSTVAFWSIVQIQNTSVYLKETIKLFIVVSIVRTVSILTMTEKSQ